MIKKTKTSELLLIKNIKILKSFSCKSITKSCDSITKNFVILINFINNSSLVLVFLFGMANTILFKLMVI